MDTWMRSSTVFQMNAIKNIITWLWQHLSRYKDKVYKAQYAKWKLIFYFFFMSTGNYKLDSELHPGLFPDGGITEIGKGFQMYPNGSPLKMCVTEEAKQIWFW